MKRGVGKRLCSILLCVAMGVSLTACGGPSNNRPVSALPDGTDALPITSDITIDTEKELIVDFYSYVSSDWFAENELSDSDIYRSTIDDDKKALSDKLYQIFEDSDELDKLPADDPMYKLKQYYNQLDDSEQRNVMAMVKIRDMVDHIMAAKSVADIQALMEDEDYSLFNDIVKISYSMNTAGDYIPTYMPAPIMGMYNDVPEESRTILMEGYANQLEVLGYSSDEALKIAGDAMKFDLKIHDFYKTISGDYVGYSKDTLTKGACSIDLIAIQESLDYYRIDWLGNKYTGVFVLDGYVEWLNEVVTKDNLEEVKAFYVVSLLANLDSVGSGDLAKAYDEAYYKMLGATEPFAEDEDKEYLFPVYPIVCFDEGAVAAYYMENYVSAERIQLADDMVKEIVSAYVTYINNIEWLDVRQKDRLNIKIKKAKVYMGQYEDYNRLEDMVIEENVVDTTLSLLKSNRKFGQRMLVEDNEYMPTSGEILSVNAFYHRDENSIVIGTGYFTADEIWDEYSYEKRLAAFGRVIAHEIGHEFDPGNIGYRNDGQYDSAWEGFWDYYGESYDAVYYYYDGMKTERGNEIMGYQTVREAFADMIAAQVLMGILEGHEDADYNAFFTEYALSQVVSMKPEFERYMVTQDTHVTPRERVNGVLYQLDKFYETYNIDNKAPFYKTELDRIKIFAVGE